MKQLKIYSDVSVDVNLDSGSPITDDSLIVELEEKVKNYTKNGYACVGSPYLVLYSNGECAFVQTLSP